MQCPNGDGELASHATHGENNLTVSYSTCPTCQGYWMDSFAANFIKLSPKEENWGTLAFNKPFSCAVCAKHLDRATGENIPDEVFVFKCPDHHGYFFPTGQLAIFKKAQKAKIAYHETWHIPLPSVASVLLGVFLVVSLAGFFAVMQGINQKQTITSQAKELLSSQNAFVSERLREVLLTAKTAQDASVTAHIPGLDAYEASMNSADLHLHTLVVKNIPQGAYEYYFTITVGGASSDTERFTFTMP